MKSRLCFFLLVLVSAMSAFADDERAVTSIAVIVYTDGGGDGIPKACFYDHSVVKDSSSWNKGLVGCEPVLIGEASTPTPKSPPEGFRNVRLNRYPMKRSNYTCESSAQLTDDGIVLHCVINIERRRQALLHPTPENTRMTGGCVNMSPNGLFPRLVGQIKLVYIL